MVSGGFSSNIWGFTFRQTWTTRAKCASIFRLDVAVSARAAHMDGKSATNSFIKGINVYY